MPSNLLLAAVLLAPRAAVTPGPKREEPVTYAARIGSDHTVWVDVENDSDDDIEVTAVVLSFYDEHGRLLAKTTVDCEDECVVNQDAAASFGPIDGPQDWRSVQATKLYYDSLPPESGSPGRPVAGLDDSLRRRQGRSGSAPIASGARQAAPPVRARAAAGSLARST